MRQQTSHHNEKRIAELKKGLNDASNKLNIGRRLNILKGKVKADFGKSKDKGRER